LALIIVAISIVYFRPKPDQSGNDSADRQAVQRTIESFGKALKNVSLLSPAVEEEMRKNYSQYITPELLDIWSRHPMQALGRLTSSPWPDRIEVSDISKLDSSTYIVLGKIIELTSEQEVAGGIASSRLAGFALIKSETGKWLVSSVALTQESDGIIFQYPVNLPVKYVSAKDWPPTVKAQPGSFSCDQTPPQNSLAQVTTQRSVGGRIYCIDFKSEGVAGSVYVGYKYSTEIEPNKMLDVSFTLRYVNCASYDGEESQTCSSERENFNPDDLVNEIVSNLIVR